MSTASTATWFVPTPSELTASRASLDFGLRRAVRFYRELAVPGIGGLRLVRQASWSVAALRIRDDISPGLRPMTVARAIEALACKVSWRYDEVEGILGTRAFNRDEPPYRWSFHELSQPRNYVRNTFRQAASRGLRDVGGLGLVTGSRFNAFELTNAGEALADAFLSAGVGTGQMSLRKRLVGWISGSDDKVTGKSMLRAMGPNHASDDERNLLAGRLFELTDDAGTKRRALRDVFAATGAMPDVEAQVVPLLKQAGFDMHADEIRVGMAFEACLENARALLAHLSGIVDGGGRPLSAVVKVAGTKGLCKAVRKAGKAYLSAVEKHGHDHADALAFAKTVVARDEEGVVQLIADKDAQVLVFTERMLRRGPLHRDMSGQASNAEDDELSDLPDRRLRIDRLYGLYVDCEAAG